MPSRPEFAMLSACKNVPLLTEVLEMAWCGVLATLNISARNASWNRSEIANLRCTPRSALNSPGPRNELVPQVPNRPEDGTAKADLAYHCKMLPTCWGALTQSANWLEEGAFSVAVEAVAVNGGPL